jgi:hypothetical protein
MQVQWSNARSANLSGFTEVSFYSQKITFTYVVYLKEKGSTSSIRVGSTKYTEITLTKLDPNTIYVVTVETVAKDTADNLEYNVIISQIEFQTAVSQVNGVS